jgi:hypothetical protein
MAELVSKHTLMQVYVAKMVCCSTGSLYLIPEKKIMTLKTDVEVKGKLRITSPLV